MTIYFIQAGVRGPIKIGWAQDVERRRETLQVGNPARLRILAVVDCGRERESEIHGMLRAHRIAGEWFRNCKEVRDAAASFGRESFIRRRDKFMMDAIARGDIA